MNQHQPTTQPSPGHASAGVRSRLCFVVESGTDVRLVEGLQDYFQLTILARKIEGGVEISHPPATPAQVKLGPAGRAGFARFVWQELRQQASAFDYILTQGYGLAAAAANSAGRLRKIPVSNLVCSPVEAYYRCRRRDEGSGKPFRRQELLALQVLARINVLVGNHTIVLSHHLADVVRAHGRSDERISIIPLYGVDCEIFQPAADAAAIRADLGLPADGPILFFSSRVAPEKDAHTLLAAFERLIQNGRKLWLLHRSGGHGDFVDLAKQFGVAENVIAGPGVHPHHELPRLYQASDLVVQASREEGLGFSVLEALACHVPVVAAAAGGLRETIIDGQTGWTYPPGDDAALTARIERVLDHRQEAVALAQEGRLLVCRQYAKPKVFQQLAQLVQERMKP